jgi:hypothetical protein
MRFTRRVYQQAFGSLKDRERLARSIQHHARLGPYSDVIGMVASGYAHTADLIAARAAREGKPLDER